ncbi:MAG: type IV pilus modification PilV family protein [Gaiellaceae bacterium]
MLSRLHTEERGFGLLELLMSMTMLSVGILATIAALNAGAITLQRASKISTATTLADAQMELYRAVKYTAIGLEPGLYSTASADSLYAGSAPTGTVDTSCGSTSLAECKPMQTVNGPDQRSYRIDSYIVAQTPTGGRPLKTVRVIVRDGSDLSRALVRQESTFDESTGS